MDRRLCCPWRLTARRRRCRSAVARMVHKFVGVRQYCAGILPHPCGMFSGGNRSPGDSVLAAGAMYVALL